MEPSLSKWSLHPIITALHVYIYTGSQLLPIDGLHHRLSVQHDEKIQFCPSDSPEIDELWTEHKFCKSVAAHYAERTPLGCFDNLITSIGVDW